jgi:hypothetical protein
MVLKEFRIALPFTVEEYRRGQLYMTAKASKEHTHGGEGVEILKNEPFEDENGKGQFTHKVFYIGSKIPAFIASWIPKGVLSVEEKSWNAYPFSKTVYTCGLAGDRFSMTVESRYQDGMIPKTEHVFKDCKSDVDFIDIVLDPVAAGKYKEEEDPSKFQSKKSGRGPLGPDWKETQKPIMCSCKLINIEFRFWGLQTSVENFVLGVLRDIFLGGHRQAFCWIDEWFEMTMEQIRAYEKETQIVLGEKLKSGTDENGNPIPISNENSK